MTNWTIWASFYLVCVSVYLCTQDVADSIWHGFQTNCLFQFLWQNSTVNWKAFNKPAKKEETISHKSNLLPVKWSRKKLDTQKKNNLNVRVCVLWLSKKNKLHSHEAELTLHLLRQTEARLFWENLHLLSSVGLWGKEMPDSLKKLREVLLQSEDDSVGSCIKRVAHLLGNKPSTLCKEGEYFCFPLLKTVTQVSHLHYKIWNIQLHLLEQK